MDTQVVEEIEYALIVRKAGGAVGRRVTLSHYPFVLGRGSSADLELETDRASRQHAEIRHVEGRFEVVDLESRNGTKVNGEVLAAPHPLAPGDVIAVGDIELEWQRVAADRLSISTDTVVLPEE